MKQKNLQKMQNLKKKTDLIFQFDFIDAIQVQQMLVALNHDYELVALSSNRGVVEFILSERFQND